MGRIGALDGWRAISIALVLIGHLVNYRFGVSEPHVTAFAAYTAQLGVKVFFVISGYLITTISLREEVTAGGFHTGAFYLRRVFRILPAFAVYLLGVGVLGAMGAIDQSTVGLVRAAEFSCNIPGRDCGWFANHTWSLAYEQQFYLLFPLAFMAALQVRRRWAIAVHVIVVAAPFAAFWLPPSAEDACLFVSRFSSITMGVVLGMLGRELIGFANRPTLLLGAGAVFAASVGVVGLNLLHLPYAVRSAIDGLLMPPTVAWMIFASVHAGGVFAKMLELRAVRYIGAISYSLYLWQQVFTGPPARYAHADWFVPILAIPMAALSYHFVEQPFVRWGRKLSGRLVGRGKPASLGVRPAG